MTLLVRLLLFAIAVSAASAQSLDDVEFFEKRVRPIMATQCQMCHSPQIKTSGLDLSSAEGFMTGGASGPLVSVENPANSLLLQVLSYKAQLKMPPTGKLPDEDIAALTEWVERGAHWPGAENWTAPAPADKADKAIFTKDQKEFWAFQPVEDLAPPAVPGDWAKSAVDRFILAKLTEEGIEPAPPATKEALLRRASYDLTGLPPSEAEIADFLADDSPRAFEKVVDRLLASPRYGERWGRHWLDLARYADSTGNDEDHRYPYAWRYRDYVIDAFNDDVPYDQFVREQIAGDLLPPPDGSALNRRGLVATGFLALGPKALAQQDKTRMLYDVYDEQIDVVSKTFLGLTMSCARCHDHKFDPLLQRDYYSMAAFFANTQSFRDPSSHVSKLLFVPLVAEETWREYERQQEEIRRRKFDIENLPEAEIEAHVAALAPQVAEYMLAARKVYEDGVSVDEAAAGLDRTLLERWIDYLKPGQETRAHLADWESATPERREGAAQAFEESFTTTFTAWREKIANWRESANKPAEEITMGAPAKPRFEPGENRFFHEIYFQKKGPLSFFAEDRRNTVLSAETKSRMAQLEAEVDELEAKAMPEPERACAVLDKTPADQVEQHLFIRGDYNSKGELAPRAFPAILEGLDQPPVADAGSGRLALANWLTEPDHPLTARVMVNRIWGWHFGKGLVGTPSNFGKMGQRPTHPELLDWLASRFVESGWSVKAVHKLIMLSAAYQMASETTPEKAQADPENKLLSHFERRRLDVEEIRDGLLAIDGAIELTMGGTLQEGFGTDGENSDSRLSVNPDDYQLRTVYLPLRRANLPALLNLFDFGDATTSQGDRAVTNVAPQALFMLNSEFVAERARALAKQLLDQERDAGERMRRIYLRTLNRAPSASEVDRGLTYVAAVGERFPAFEELDAWQSLCRVLMASNEFIYVD